MTITTGSIGHNSGGRYHSRKLVKCGSSIRAKELGQGPRKLSEKVKRFIRKRDNYTCKACGVSPANYVDHIIPWRISHDDSPSNLQVLCHKCNIKKRLPRRDARLSLDEWIDKLHVQLDYYKVQGGLKLQPKLAHVLSLCKKGIGEV